MERCRLGRTRRSMDHWGAWSVSTSSHHALCTLSCAWHLCCDVTSALQVPQVCWPKPISHGYYLMNREDWLPLRKLRHWHGQAAPACRGGSVSSNHHKWNRKWNQRINYKWLRNTMVLKGLGDSSKTNGVIWARIPGRNDPEKQCAGRKTDLVPMNT